MKKLIFLIVAVLQLATQVNSQWVLQTPPTANNIYNIHFLNSNTGFIAAGMGTIMKTTNGGTNWVSQSTGITLEVNNIYFQDVNTGFAVCGDYSPLNIGAILKTTNGGANWISKFSSNRICLRQAIHFINTNTGFVAGWANMDSAVYKTTNGGENWQSANVPGVYGIDNFSFIDANTGWGAGYGVSDASIIRTTNGGVNWTKIYSISPLPPVFMSLQFVNANTGWIVGISTSNRSLIKKTTDGGFNWVDQVHNHTTQWELYNINMINVNTGWIVGDVGVIVKTTNGGTNWRAQTNPPSYTLFAVEFNGADTGWVVGLNGKLFKTVNGGGPVSVQNISTEIPSSFSLSQNYPNPFNNTSNLKFEIARHGGSSTSDVKIIVYDVMGREVQTLVNERLQPGTYETTFDGSALNSGVYFYKLTTDGYTETKRMLMIK